MLPKHVRYQTALHPDGETVPHKERDYYNTGNPVCQYIPRAKFMLRTARGGMGRWQPEKRPAT